MPRTGWCCATTASGSFTRLADIVVPGVTFEQIIRAVAERGIVAGMADWRRKLDLGATRTALSSGIAPAPSARRPLDPDQRAQDPGRRHVGIYTDVTELKRAEEAARKDGVPGDEPGGHQRCQPGEENKRAAASAR